MIYISDLDGTLLNDQAKISNYTLNVIKDIRKKGIKFTIATARSFQTAIKFIEKLDLQYPCILRNGSIIYDPIKKEIIDEKMIGYELAIKIIEDLQAFNLRPIVHCKNNNHEHVDYIKVKNHGEKFYIESRLKSKDKRFREVKKYEYSKEYSFASICSIQKEHKDILKHLSEKYSDKCEIQCYDDNYTKFSWLEFTCVGSNKKTACESLLTYINEDKYIAFGDGDNDIEMLLNAYESYIPKQSHLYKHDSKFKVIESNENNGVAKFLMNKYLK